MDIHTLLRLRLALSDGQTRWEAIAQAGLTGEEAEEMDKILYHMYDLGYTNAEHNATSEIQICSWEV